MNRALFIAATPTRSQLEEDAQFLIAFTTLAEEMTFDQLLRCLGRLSQHPKLTAESRMFWTKMIGPWFLVKADAEKAALEHAKKQQVTNPTKTAARKKR